ncbi:MAG: glycoside hydrolase family 2 TIM barrel-domain containing protein, partial [Pedobacter sp.]|uniref:glycoside hydrolase family 2 protein n=1 Tax=Pedobacter sp. TaxID=1411316 RepID=UPI0035613DF5
MLSKPILLVLFAVFITLHTFGQSTVRKIVNINQGWSFHKENSSAITQVTIPHTWNTFDVMDDEPGYYRGIGWYRKKLALKPEWKNKKISLYFEGANQETTVYLNGKKIGSHIGGYTAFTVPLNALKFNGTDEIAVKVDNSFNENIAPLTADFTFFGGMYRNVSLVVLNPIHFEDNKYASKGVYVHTNNVTKTNAEVIVSGNLINSSANGDLTIRTTLTDATGKKVNETKTLVHSTLNKLIPFTLAAIKVNNPILWSPENPYLYQSTTQLIDKTGKVLDEVKLPVGLRFFSFDADKGFFLNGMPYKLIGTSRHQDFAGMGNAVPSALQVKDVQLLKDMGGNFLRVAHYPQDQAVLDACDRMGILASVEIPIVNEITESEAFSRNCKSMQLEMIKQNYNHPSIIIWAYMNEVLLRMKFANDPIRKEKYIKNITVLAQELEDLTRATDPTRYTMISNHGDVNGYMKAGLVKIPMVVGWNLYQGWYGGKSEDFGPNLDKIHQQIPDKPILVSEFGADIDPRIHSFSPVRFDKSLEYGMLYHQIYIAAILKRPFVAGAAVWNLADFNSETRDETMPHINNKGLLTIDRQPKNTYYLYKANFQRKPFLKIGDGSWKLRGGIACSNERTLSQPLQVISNTDTVELFVNGKSLGKKGVNERISNWDVSFKNGMNDIKAVSFAHGLKIEDLAHLSFSLQPLALNNLEIPFKEINILLGSQRQFVNEQKHEIWLPSQPYKAGSWGSVGGEAFKIKNSGRQSYGSDKNIRGTFNDPIYQTQLIGLESYQLDVPKGKYEVTMH